MLVPRKYEYFEQNFRTIFQSIIFFSLGAIPGLELVFVNQVMLDLIAIDLVLLIPGERIVVMCVIARTMHFAMVQMEPVLVHQDISERSMCNSTINLCE